MRGPRCAGTACAGVPWPHARGITAPGQGQGAATSRLRAHAPGREPHRGTSHAHAGRKAASGHAGATPGRADRAGGEHAARVGQGPGKKGAGRERRGAHRGDGRRGRTASRGRGSSEWRGRGGGERGELRGERERKTCVGVEEMNRGMGWGAYRWGPPGDGGAGATAHARTARWTRGRRLRARGAWATLPRRAGPRGGNAGPREGEGRPRAGHAPGWAAGERRAKQAARRRKRGKDGFGFFFLFSLFNLFSNLCFSSSSSLKCMFHKFTQQTKYMHGPA
jgi:hypothetical protein